MLYPFIRYFQWFSSPCPVFIIISICAHSHGSVKHWWHSSQSINGYMVTSTKIWYLGSFVFFMKLKWVLYEMLHYVYIVYISICKSWVWYFMLFHVICCHVYNIYWTHHVEFLSIYDMCMLCDRRVIYQCTCVFVHHYGILYCDILYLYDISCFWCFNIHLFCAIVWNTDMTYDIYHFNHKSQYVVQL